MRCREARKILGQDIEGGDALPVRDDIRAHLDSCAACAEFADQLRRTWALLGAVPAIPVSGSFNRSALARVRQDASSRRWWTLDRVVGWQWMTLAACVLLLAVIVVPGIVDRQPVLRVSSTDQWDDSFLQDLDSSLDRSETNYLPAYDVWADEAAPGQESPSETPGVQDNPAGVRHGKS